MSKNIQELLVKLNIEVKDIGQNPYLSPIQLSHIMCDGVVAFVDVRVGNTIFTVNDDIYVNEVSDYVLTHELGHALCRRNQDDPLTKFYERILSSPILTLKIHIEKEALSQQEEHKVDLFALKLKHNYFKQQYSEKEQQVLSNRLQAYKDKLGEELSLSLEKEADIMVSNIIANF